MSTHLITPPGTAELFVFDYVFNLVATLPVLTGVADLGPIFETTTPGVITGIIQGSGNSLGLWQYNVTTQTLIAHVELPIIGTLGTYCQKFDGSVWTMSGNNLVRVDISALTAAVQQDLTSIAPVVKMSFDSSSTTIWLAGGVNGGVNGAQVFSIKVSSGLAAEGLVGTGEVFSAALITNGHSTLFAEALVGTGIVYDATLSLPQGVSGGIAEQVVPLLNDESTAVLRGQPVYSSVDGGVRLAVADGSGRSLIVGIVVDASIAPSVTGNIAIAGGVSANSSEWDAVCGTTGGLIADTIYYLHPSIPGRLTATAPTASGQEVVAVLKALSPTQAVLATTRPILL
jgi:hypothetical protein